VEIISKPDSRNDCPRNFSSNGIYYVSKKNVVARFSFGKNGSFETISEAFSAMALWLAKRKDADKLNVQLMPRERYNK